MKTKNKSNREKKKEKKTLVPSGPPPVHSAVSWGYCSRRGVLQGPEWRTAWWMEVGEEATGRRAA